MKATMKQIGLEILVGFAVVLAIFFSATGVICAVALVALFTVECRPWSYATPMVLFIFWAIGRYADDKPILRKRRP